MIYRCILPYIFYQLISTEIIFRTRCKKCRLFFMQKYYVQSILYSNNIVSLHDTCIKIFPCRSILLLHIIDLKTVARSYSCYDVLFYYSKFLSIVNGLYTGFNNNITTDIPVMGYIFFIII